MNTMSTNNNNFSGTVQASNAMFRTLAKTHIDDSWGYTLAKEVWQNIIDLPEVSQLEIRTKQVEVENPYDWLREDAEFYKITFLDNGPGMDLETLKNVYLFYGETTKAYNEDCVGGYGLGRVVCTFGAVSYRLASKDWVCVGTGGSYKIEKNESYLDGFLLEVVIPSVDRSGYAESIQSSIREYLCKCSSNRISVTLNGNKVDLHERNTQGSENLVLDENKWGTVKYDKPQHLGAKHMEVYAVNSKGDILFLYKEHLYNSMEKVRIEVRADLTKQSMNISRSAFSGRYADEIENIKQELSSRAKFETEEKTFLEGDLDDGFLVKSTTITSIDQKISLKDLPEELVRELIGMMEDHQEDNNSIKKEKKERRELPYVITCTGADKERMIAMKDQRYGEFLAIWDELVIQFACNVLPNIVPNLNNVRVQTAILLSEKAHGVCYSPKYMHKVVAANPTSIKTFGMMLATAMHEVCHIAKNSHCEEFAATLSYFIAGTYGMKFDELEERWNKWREMMSQPTVPAPKPKKVITVRVEPKKEVKIDKPIIKKKHIIPVFEDDSIDLI